MLSISRDENLIRELFRSGANGYILKDGPARHLFDAINYIQDGGQYLTPLIRREAVDTKVDKKDSLTLLSRREYEVFSFLVDGMRPKDIAKMLGNKSKNSGHLSREYHAQAGSRRHRRPRSLRHPAESSDQLDSLLNSIRQGFQAGRDAELSIG